LKLAKRGEDWRSQRGSGKGTGITQTFFNEYYEHV